MHDSAFSESCKREFALWRKLWRAHKTSACAAKLQQHHFAMQQTRSTETAPQPSPAEAADDARRDESLPPLAPPPTLRSFSEMR